MKDFVGFQKCGCAVVWISGDEDPTWIAKRVEAAIQRGLNVERRTTEWSRKNMRACPHKPAQPVEPVQLTIPELT